MALRFLRRLTSSGDVDKEAAMAENYPLQDPNACKQLRKGNFVILLDKPLYHDGETLTGKIFCDRRKFYEQRGTCEILLSFEIIEYFQMVTYHQDNCWSWGELNTLSKKEVPLYRPNGVATLVEMCLVAMLKHFKDTDIKKMSLPQELRERLSVFTWSFNARIPFGFPPSMKYRSANPGSPSFEYSLQVLVAEKDGARKSLAEKHVEVVNYIPPLVAPQPIASHSHKNLLALTTYLEGQVLYPGSTVTINIRDLLSNLGSTVRIKVMQRIVVKRHKDVPRDCIVHPELLQEEKLSTRQLVPVQQYDGTTSYNISFVLSPTKSFFDSYKRHKGNIRIIHLIKVSAGNRRKLGEINVTLSHPPASPAIEADLATRRPAKFSRSVHSIVETRHYHQKWDWLF